jgi:hypothetical protein
VTRTERRFGSALIVTAAALLVAACGGSQEGGDASSPSPSASTVSPSQTTGQQRPADRLTIDINIEGGNVTPTNARLQGKVGEPIVLRVNSDAADELHVHSVPDHSFTIEPKTGQMFQFSVDVPGNVEIELHELNRVIASVQVQ